MYEDDLRAAQGKARELFELTSNLMAHYETDQREWQILYQVFRAAHLAIDITANELKWRNK